MCRFHIAEVSEELQRHAHRCSPARVQAMLLADLRDQLDLHGMPQAQQYLQERLSGGGRAPVKRLVSTDANFKEARMTVLPAQCCT